MDASLWPTRETLDEASLKDGPPAESAPWRPVLLPAPWPRVGLPVRTYRFDLSDRPARVGGERIHLRFSACATEVEVLLDGRVLGRHVGDWVPFDVEIPPDHEGARELLVIVDEKPAHPTRGFLPTCRLVHGGLWQEVALLRTGPWTLRRDDVRARCDGRFVVVDAPVDGPRGHQLRIEIRERSAFGGWSVGGLVAEGTGPGPVVEVEVPKLARWSPASPRLYEARVSVHDPDGRRSDRCIVPFGVRTVSLDGDRLLLNGEPLLLRGLLHWGYYPEIGAPNPDVPALARELSHLRIRGFNAVKCCLFVPPKAFLDLADEMGILVWQEYPLWLEPLSGDDLLREYAAFFRHDRQHPSVILRTLTCENDRIDPAALERLSALARDHLPGELLLDNSAWLQLSRRGDFYDEHPYLHNAQWDPYLERTRKALDERPRKPLLLGETMAVDTLPSEHDLHELAPPAAPLYKHAYLQILGEWTGTGERPPGLRRRALRIAEAVRRHQIERLRLKLPGAGYVLNASRDIPLCPCGFSDAYGRPKFPLDRCGGQDDTMVLVDLPRRSFAPGEEVHVPIHVSHFGAGPLQLDAPSWSFGFVKGEFPPRSVAAGSNARLGEAVIRLDPTEAPIRELLNVTACPGRPLIQAWELWNIPRAEVPSEVLVTRSLREAWPRLEDGGSVILLAADPVAGGWRAPEFTFWSFIPHLAPHPLWSGEARDLVQELLPFDLLSGRVLAWSPGAGTPLLEILDLHGKPGEARRLPLIIEARAGRGRLAISALEHEDTPAGRWLLAAIGRQLLRRRFDADPVERPPDVETLLLGGPWTMKGAGRIVGTGTPRRNRGVNVFEGWETFQGTVTLPGAFADQRVLLRAEAVGDAYEILVDGERLLFAGDEHGVLDGMRDRPLTRDITGALDVGRRHRIELRIRDWRGAGGLIGPVYLTTEDPEARLIY